MSKKNNIVGSSYFTTAGFVETYNPLRAYALKKLSGYATRAVRVRRSSDNTEMDIGFVGEDLDTATLLTFVGTGDGFVTRFYDQSASPIDAWNTTATQQPYIVISGVLCTKNGKPSLRATSAATRYLKINNLTSPVDVQTQVIVASTSDINGGTVQYVATNLVGSGQGILIGGDPAYFPGICHFYNGTYVASNIKTLNQLLIASEWNGNSPTRLATMFVNATAYANNTNIGTNNSATARLMGIGSGFGVGIIGDFQLYISFTTSQKALIPTMHNELNTYYGAY